MTFVQECLTQKCCDPHACHMEIVTQYVSVIADIGTIDGENGYNALLTRHLADH